MAQCENECIAEYTCEPLREHLEGAVFSPFVELNVLSRDGQHIYTVGNKPSPKDENRTSIKSFQYGFSVANGVGAKFELISEGGQAYFNLIDALNKSVKNADSDTGNTWFTFGWIIKKCDDSTLKKESQPIYLMGKTLQSIFENGIMKITYECIDLGTRIFGRTVEGNEGEEQAEITLKEGIKRILSNNDPVIDVDFRKIKNGVLGEPWEFQTNPPDGPMGAWKANQQNALAAIRSWLAEERTSSDKGIIFQYDPSGPNPILHLIEDWKPGKGEKIPCCENSIGTYVVNGGNCTDVRSFTPTIDWLLIGPGKGGDGAGIDDGHIDKAQKTNEEFERIEDNGPMEAIIPSSDSKNRRSPKETGENAIKSSEAHTKANKDFEAKPGIQGELKLTGDPEFWNPVRFVGRNVSIVVIDPYHIEGCEWIASSKCNVVLSNKNWLILGIDHQISEGNFETTIKVMLSAPNEDIDQGEPLGGGDCGKYYPINDEGKPKED